MDEHSARICFCLASCAVKQGKMYYAGKVRTVIAHSFCCVLMRSDNCRGLTSPPFQYTASFPSSPEHACVHVPPVLPPLPLPPPSPPHTFIFSPLYSLPLLSLSLHPGPQSPHVSLSSSSLLVSRGCCEEGPLHGSGVLPEGLLPPPRKKVSTHQDSYPRHTYVAKSTQFGEGLCVEVVVHIWLRCVYICMYVCMYVPFTAEIFPF